MTPREASFVKILSDSGVVSDDELAHLRRACKQRLLESGEPEPLWEVAISENLITPAQAERLLEELDRAEKSQTVIEVRQDRTEEPPAPGQIQTVIEVAPRSDEEAPPADDHVQMVIEVGRQRDDDSGKARGLQPTVVEPTSPQAAAPAPATPAAPDKYDTRNLVPGGSPAAKTSSAGGMNLGGYLLSSKLGQGGMGAVYKAYQESMDRTVAIKVLPRNLAKNQEFINRFLREARAAGRLSHPGIVAGIDAGFDQGYYYFAMEYVEGHSLGDDLEKNPLEEEEVIRIGRQIADGLDHAHAAGIIHRDVKPENILVTESGQAKLCDLGLARSSDDDMRITQAGMAVGTPYYISPEQVKGKEPDARSDVYSLGASLYHMITGMPPFDGDNAMAIMHQHLNETPPLPTELRPNGVSRALEAVIFKMMARDIRERYQDMQEVEEDLAKVASGEIPEALKGAVADRRRADRSAGSGEGTGRGTTRTGTTRTGRAVGRRTARMRALAEEKRRAFPVKLATIGAALLVLAAFASYAMFKSSATPEGGGRRNGLVADPHEALLAGLSDEFDKIQYYDKTRPKDYGTLITRYSDFLARARNTKFESLAQQALIAVKARRNRDDSRERIEKLGAKFDVISAYEKQNPENYRKVLYRYATLLAGAAGTDFEPRVRKAMDATLARRREKAGLLLAAARSDARRLQSEGNFGKALARVRSFPVGYAPAVKKGLAGLRQSIIQAGTGRWKEILAAANALAGKKDFAAARRKAETGRKLGLTEVDTAVSQALTRIEQLRLAEESRKANLSRKEYDRFRVEYSKLIAAGKFSDAVKQGGALKGKLSPELEKRLAADLSLAGGADAFRSTLRTRLDKARRGSFTVKLPGLGVAGRFMGYSSRRGIDFRFGANRTTVQIDDFKGKQLLALARAVAGGTFTPADSRAAACYLALTGSTDGLDVLVYNAKSGGQDVSALESRIQVLRKGAREVEAERLLTRFDRLRAAKSWQAAALVGARLLKDFGGSKAIAARKNLSALVDEAKHAGSPLQTFEITLQEGQPVPAAGVTAYRGAKTSYVYNYASHADTGHEGTVKMQGNSFTSPVISFAITRREGGPLPDDVEILEARLLLYKTKAYTPYLLLRPMLGKWDEKTVCWNSSATDRKWSTPGGAVAGKTAGVSDLPGLYSSLPKGEQKDRLWTGPWWCEFDVGASLGAALKARRNFGWRVDIYGGASLKRHANLVYFAGRLNETIANRPKLVLKVRCRGLKKVAPAPRPTGKGFVAAWRKLALTGESPSYRVETAMAMTYDSKRKRSVLFGGHRLGKDLNDLWALDLAAGRWTCLQKSGEGADRPGGRREHHFNYDSQGDRYWVNLRWRYAPSSGRWKNMSAARNIRRIRLRVRCGLAYSPRSGQFLMCRWEKGSRPLSSFTYSPSRGRATFYPGDAPLRSYLDGGLAYDAANRVFVLFGGGSGAPGSPLHNDTWIFDPRKGAWREMKPPTSPPARSRHRLVWHGGIGAIVMAGGTSGPDLWVYEAGANRWTELRTPTQPPMCGKGAGAMTYDAAHDTLVHFGKAAQTWGLKISRRK